jgi:flagellar export protein FliJ
VNGVADASTLTLLLEQAQQARDQALLELRQAEARVAQAKAQAKDLGDYQQQYDQRWLAQFREQGAGVAIVQAHQQFGLRLQDAIGQQTQQAVVLEARLAAARQRLLEREMAVAKVAKLIERRQAELLARRLKADQKAMDEFGAQRHRSSNPSPGA